VGEWLQQATLAIRAQVPLGVLTDTIQPLPTFSEIFVAALKAQPHRDEEGERRALRRYQRESVVNVASLP
jgi:hypothetical protein